MNDQSQDRRIVRTRRALQAALIQLILEKGYDAVTIEEITDRADLGRTTFYLHFKDKEELFMHAIDTICEDFLEKHKNLLTMIDNRDRAFDHPQLNLDERILYHIFAHARDNADLYRVMLRGEGGAKASRRFSEVIQQEIIKRLRKAEGLKSKVPLEIFAVFFSGTLIELVTWWLEHDQPFTIEEMVVYFQQLFILGALDTFHLSA
jgi:AcrR family transcriptional regulator